MKSGNKVKEQNKTRLIVQMSRRLKWLVQGKSGSVRNFKTDDFPTSILALLVS